MSAPHRPPADATTRFADRVDAYVRARPDYPVAVIELLRTHAGLGPGTVVADVGAGTGILTRMLARTGATVHAVEPNGPMLAALIAELDPSSTVRTHRRPAEATNLSDAGIDLITAAQAFHWFDRDAARSEFRRILRPSGWVALIWNSRQTDSSPFMAGYQGLLDRWAPDHRVVNHQNVDASAIEEFFSPGSVRRHTADHHQVLDVDGVCDRLLSSSYAPPAGHPDHEPMLADLRTLVQRHGEDGAIRFEYLTEVYLGRFAP